MCGIAGIITFDGAQVDQAQLDVLIDALAHRGPNGRGTYVHGSVGLAQRRLSVLDLSDAASQPMISSDGKTVLVFNGEIYNFAEKRRMLEDRGHVFHSTGDTEVLLKLYEEFGPQCVDHLRGMFAFAVHDLKRGIVFLARDRVGKKPLKYFSDGKVFAFASELKALRTLPSCPKSMDAEAVHHYLTMMYVPAPATGIVGIQKLPAATALTIDLSGKPMEQKKYWELRYDTDEATPLETWKEKIVHTFNESVHLRMVADVPVGAFLSGGIDSAAVVAFMTRHSAHPVQTFSIGSSVDSHNELPDADRIAKLFGTNHHPLLVEPDIVHLLPELVHTYEEPYADSSAIPTYLIARESRKSVTVALNGDGGDENFAGYVRYPILRFSNTWATYPGFVHALARLGTTVFHRLANTTFSYRCKRFEHSMHLPWPERSLQYLSFFTDAEKRGLYAAGFGKNFPATDSWYAARTADARERAKEILHQSMSMDIASYLADDLLPKVDLGSMAFGLEARSPFLDHELLELTARIPARYKLHGKSKKWILKEVLKGIVPDETLTRPKSGFRLPLDHWFRTNLASFVDDRLLSADSKLWAIFDRAKMETFLKMYRISKVDYSDHIWALLWLDEWMRQYT